MKRSNTILSWLILLLLATGLPLAAQERMALRGKVLDAQTRKPVLFSKVWLMSGAVNTYTDPEGRFTVEVPAGHPPDTLAFSSIQYNLFKVPLSQLSQDTLVVALSRRTLADLELPFKVGSPESIVRLAVDAIPENYGKSATLLQVGYQEQLEVTGNNPLFARAEGVFEWYKPNYRSGTESERVGRFNGRRDSLYSRFLLDYYTFQVTPQNYPLSNGGRVTNFPRNNSRYFRLFYGYNPCFYHQSDLEELDAVKYSESFLNQERVRQYRFQLLDYTTIGGELVLVIGFKPKNLWVTKAYFTGRLFIKPDDKAIVRAEFQLTPGELIYFNYNSKIETLGRTYVVTYAKRGEQWYFDHGSISTSFIRHRGQLPATASVNFQVVKHDPGNTSPLTSIKNHKQPFVSQLPYRGSR